MEAKDIVIIAMAILAIVFMVLFMYVNEAYNELEKRKDDIWKLYKSECERNIAQMKQDILRDDIEEHDLPC